MREGWGESLVGCVIVDTTTRLSTDGVFLLANYGKSLVSTPFNYDINPDHVMSSDQLFVL